MCVVNLNGISRADLEALATADAFRNIYYWLALIIHFHGFFGTGALATGTAGNTFSGNKFGYATGFLYLFFFCHI